MEQFLPAARYLAERRACVSEAGSWDHAESGGWTGHEKRRQPLEQIFYQLGRDKEMSESTGHRLEMLLDLQWDEDGFMLKKLSRLIRFVRSKGYAVDCQWLLEDLFYWNGEKQSVQRKWARALYIKPEEQQEELKGE